jgi:hypothetical protein
MTKWERCAGGGGGGGGIDSMIDCERCSIDGDTVLLKAVIEVVVLDLTLGGGIPLMDCYFAIVIAAGDVPDSEELDLLVSAGHSSFQASTINSLPALCLHVANPQLPRLLSLSSVQFTLRYAEVLGPAGFSYKSGVSAQLMKYMMSELSIKGRLCCGSSVFIIVLPSCRHAT